MWFSSWHSLLRIVAVGVPAYFAALLLLRAGGKRTLSKFNAFDLVVTVAFGSTLSSGLLNRDVALLDIVAAFALLVLLQFLVTSTLLRWPAAEKLIKAQPRLLFRNGRFLHGAMAAERITDREVEAAVRSHGIASLEAVDAVILEADGTLAVLASTHHQPTALRSVRGLDA
jgi:uncharacterized membrane protein YcaP (DUF421 family)